MAAPFPNQPSYPNYDFQMMQPHPTSYPPFPADQMTTAHANPMWSHIPPPPVITSVEQQPKMPFEMDDEKQKIEGTPPNAMRSNRLGQTRNLETPHLQEQQCTIPAGIAQEKQNQRETLLKQREDYQRRVSALRRELKVLKNNRDDLTSGNEPPSPTTNRFIDENSRLQVNAPISISQTAQSLYIRLFCVFRK